MVTRALVKAEIDNLRDDDVEIVYSLIKRILRQSDQAHTPPLLIKLQSVAIQGPPDFSRNLDYYLKLQEGTPSPLYLPAMSDFDDCK